MSGFKVITPPAQVIMTADIKTHLRHVTTTGAQDAEMVSFLAAALDHAQEYCGQSFGSQTLEAAFDRFPCGSYQALELPRGPVTSVTSVKYIDENGTVQTLVGANYVLDDYGLTTKIYRSFGIVWPTIQDVANAVKVVYVAGAAVLPAAVRAALLMHVYEMDQHRSADIDVPAGVISLLDTAKRWGR